jgi:FlaG/FlaF family flagellin (archaellin)
MANIKDKKAMSEVVSTVLLIAIAVVAVSVVSLVVIPMIKDNLERVKCSDFMSSVSIVDDEYTFYNESSGKASIHISRGSDAGIGGIAISISAQGSSKNFKIFDSINIDNVFMQDGSSELNIPDKGEERTYIFSDIDANKASVAPIIGKTACDFIDSTPLKSVY